jgi:hypothetical protein
MIDQWHRDRGWNGIGYHSVIVNDKHDSAKDGKIQNGRDIGMICAHARGLNSRSIGLCCIGHGDYEPFTVAQNESLVAKVSDLIDEYEDINVENVIGHRELNRLVTEGLLSNECATSKTCPRRNVDMVALRDRIRKHREIAVDFELVEELNQDDKDDLLAALTTLEKTSEKVFPDSNAELREFLSHPEVIAFRG